MRRWLTRDGLARLLDLNPLEGLLFPYYMKWQYEFLRDRIALRVAGTTLTTEDVLKIAFILATDARLLILNPPAADVVVTITRALADGVRRDLAWSDDMRDMLRNYITLRDFVGAINGRFLTFVRTSGPPDNVRYMPYILTRALFGACEMGYTNLPGETPDSALRLALDRAEDLWSALLCTIDTTNPGKLSFDWFDQNMNDVFLRTAFGDPRGAYTTGPPARVRSDSAAERFRIWKPPLDAAPGPGAPIVYTTNPDAELTHAHLHTQADRDRFFVAEIGIIPTPPLDVMVNYLLNGDSRTLYPALVPGPTTEGRIKLRLFAPCLIDYEHICNAIDVYLGPLLLQVTRAVFPGETQGRSTLFDLPTRYSAVPPDRFAFLAQGAVTYLGKGLTLDAPRLFYTTDAASLSEPSLPIGDMVACVTHNVPALIQPNEGTVYGFVDPDKARFFPLLNGPGDTAKTLVDRRYNERTWLTIVHNNLAANSKLELLSKYVLPGLAAAPDVSAESLENIKGSEPLVILTAVLPILVGGRFSRAIAALPPLVITPTGGAQWPLAPHATPIPTDKDDVTVRTMRRVLGRLARGDIVDAYAANGLGWNVTMLGRARPLADNTSRTQLTASLAYLQDMCPIAKLPLLLDVAASLFVTDADLATRLTAAQAIIESLERTVQAQSTSLEKRLSDLQVLSPLLCFLSQRRRAPALCGTFRSACTCRRRCTCRGPKLPGSCRSTLRLHGASMKQASGAAMNANACDSGASRDSRT